MKIFLIAGKAGSGKNEVAKWIKKKLPQTIVTGFSKYIKLFALEFTDWNGKEESKPRAFLQKMGDTLREIEQNYLTKRMEEDLKVYEKMNIENVVISDVRLKSEIEYFKKNKNREVITIQVCSKENRRKLNKEQMQHHTETELDSYSKFDYIIHNTYDEKTLEKEVIKILERRC